jgi:hypothetical protein
MFYLRFIVLVPFIWGALMLYQKPFENLNLKFIFSVMGISIFIAFSDVIKNFLLKQLANWSAERKEAKAWKKDLARKVAEIEAIGKANNAVTGDALERETKAIMARMEAGDKLQSKLYEQYEKLTATGDSSYEYLKKEIRNMPAMKNTNFNL